MKKEYQDQFNKFYYGFIKDKNIKKLSGAEWYNQNAIKCVNQALGRVIRHSNDYGCMLLIDSRYQQNNNRFLISKWIRDQAIIYNNKNNDKLISNIQKFFIEAEDFTNKKIEEQKKLNEIKKLTENKESSKKNKKVKGKIEKIINDDDFMDDKEKKYNEEILKNSIYQSKKKNKLVRLNDDQHFNIINDIKIDEIKNSNNNQKLKEKQLKKQKTTNNKDKSNNSNQSDNFLGDNFDFEAIFGDDLKVNESEKQNDKNKENKNNNNININNNIIINNNVIIKNNTHSNEDHNEFSPDIFNNIGANFFEDLKDAKNTTAKKEKSNNNIKNNIKENEESSNKKEVKREKGFTIDELIDQLIKNKDDSNFKEALKEKGLNFNIANKDSKGSDSSIKNVIECPICFRTTEDENVKMEHLKCGHCFCKGCIDTLKEKKKSSEKLKCPKCLTKINIKDITPLYL